MAKMNKKKKALIISSVVAVALIPIIGVSACVATRNNKGTKPAEDPITPTPENPNPETPSVDKDKEAVIKDLNDLMNSIDDLISKLDKEKDADLIAQLEELKKQVQDALDNSANLTVEELEKVKNEVNDKLNEILNSKKEDDRLLLQKYNELKNKVVEYLNLIKDNTKYASVSQKLENLISSIEQSFNKYSEVELLSSEQIDEINADLEVKEAEFIKIQFDKALVDLSEAIENNKNFINSLGNPALSKYTPLIDKFRDENENINSVIDNLVDRESAISSDITKVVNITKELSNLVEIEKLYKEKLDQDQLLNDLINQGKIDSLTAEEQKQWDKLFADAKVVASFDNKENWNVEITKEALENFVNASNSFIEQKQEQYDQANEINKAKEELKQIKEEQLDPFLDELKQDSSNKYDKIIENLTNVQNKVNEVLNNPNATLEDIKNAKDEMLAALEQAKKDKLEDDIANSNLNELHQQLSQLIDQVNEWINTNLTTSGSDYIKNPLLEAIENAKTFLTSEEQAAIREAIKELNNKYLEAQSEFNKYNSAKNILNQTITEASATLVVVESNPTIKAELEAVINEATSKVDVANTEELKNLNDSLMAAIQKAQSDFNQYTQAKNELSSTIAKANELLATLDKYPNIKSELEQIRNNANNKLNTANTEELKQLNQTLAAAIDKAKEDVLKQDRDESKNKLQETINKVEEFINETERWADSDTFGELKQEISDYLDSIKAELTETEDIQGDTSRFNQKNEELTNQFENFKNKYEALDKQKELEELKKVIASSTDFSNKELVDSKYQSIKDTLDKVIDKSNSLANSNLNDLTKEQIKEQLEELQATLDKAKEDKKNYDTSLTKEKLQKLNQLISEVEQFINTNLTEQGENDIKVELSTSKTQNSPSTGDADNVLENKYLNLQKAFNNAKQKENERNIAKQALEDKINELTQFIGKLSENAIADNLRNELNSLKNSANDTLTNGTAEQINSKLKEISDKLANAKQQNNIINKLIALEEKIKEATTLTTTERTSADAGLSSEIELVEQASNSSQSLLDSIKNNISSSLNQAINIENSTRELENAINKYNFNKAEREKSKQELKGFIENQAKKYLNETLGDNPDYSELKTELQQQITTSEGLLTTGTKAQIDQDIVDWYSILKNISEGKTAIDQKSQSKEQARNALVELLGQVKKWRVTNLTKGENSEELQKQGYKTIDDSIKTQISRGEIISNNQNLTAEQYQKMYNSLNSQWYTTQGKFKEHQNSYANLESKIKSLNDYINSELSDPKYTELKEKYTAKINDANSIKDSLDKDGLDQKARELEELLNQAKAEKLQLESNEEKNRLNELISQAKEFANNSETGLNKDIYTNIKSELEAVIAKAEENIESSSRDELKSKYESLNTAFEKAKTDQKNKATELYNQAVLEGNQWINQNLNQSEKGEWTDPNSTKVIYDKTVQNNSLVSTDSANDILAKTENIKNALENAKNMKSERDAAKIELQNKITEAEALLVKLGSANIEQNLRDNLRKQIDFAKNALTDLSKDGILLAKSNLESEINKSLEALRNKLREWIENTKTLQTKVDVYRDQGLEVESNRLATVLEKVQPNIDSIDESELLSRINEISSVNGDVNRIYNQWYPLKVDMISQINTLENIITEMKKQPNVHSKYIKEAESKLVGWKSLKTISQLSSGLSQIKSYIPALNRVKTQYENAYNDYVNSKTNAEQLRKLLEANSSYVSDFDTRVLNAAKVYEDKFLADPSTNIISNLTEGKKILDTALAVYKEKIKLEQDKITILINGGVASNAQNVKAFSTVTNSTKPEHKNIALDNIAINERNDLSSKYANIRPEDDLNSLVIRTDSSNKPSVQEFLDLNSKLTELTKADSIINKILDDNWTRNGEKWLYTLSKAELQKAYDNNLKNNADSGSIDKKVLDLSKTEAWSYNGTDKSKYTTYRKQFETLINEYKELTRAGSVNYNRTQTNIANALKITNNNLVGNWSELKDTLQYWDDGYFREYQINHNDFNTITRSIGAPNGEMVYEDILQAKLRTKTSLVESFLRLETLRSMQNFMNYWNNFGGYKYQNPLIKGNNDYNVLKNYVYKFYRYQTKGTTNYNIHLWTRQAKNRYWSQNGNFNYEIRTLERDNFNADGEVGILDYARRNWGGTLVWNDRHQRAINQWDVWVKDGLYVTFIRVWSDIRKIYEKYEQLLDDLNSNKIKSEQFIQYKIDIKYFVDSIYSDNYKYQQTDSLGIFIDLFHPSLLNVLAYFVETYNV
ncbi:hypothetical protein [Mycoplasmopsis anatis]|uniref:hypothetical protein n=1 Tax=Mycoplasmopsis anatis TaxID=171279 RepID=UPI001C4E5548|nr:hypothetical protein [Mycoplasmopsis anatis]MBW0596661.1 hypothetical protein [Mycoplasmopsis anatis]